MLTKRENFLETIRGGRPDRFVNQFEAFRILYNPIMMHSPMPGPGDLDVVNDWGVVNSWPAGTPGPFPVHRPDTIVIKDITHWRDYIHAPNTRYSDAEWEPFIRQVEETDRKEYFVTPFAAPGLFEQCHHLGEIQNTLINFYEEPEYMHELIDYLTEYELSLGEEICRRLKPDALFHHDDWGSQTSTFISPEMFEEFYLPSYKKIYGLYRSMGVDVIVHHSDSYAATLVPYMIEMGIDVWQGVMCSNNIQDQITKYGGMISIMGCIDSAKVVDEGWSREVIAKEVRRACDENGRLYFIPNTSQGLPMSTFPGVYETVTEEIKKYSNVVFD